MPSDPHRYLLSYIVFQLTGRCDIDTLRLLNTVSLVVVAYVSTQLLRRINASRAGGSDASSLAIEHSALNVALFPPLLFFSGLYYTDVVSALLVLIQYYWLLTGMRSGKTNIGGSLVQVLLGSAALLFRQTNIFWIAVFPAGLVIVNTAKSALPDSKSVNATSGSRWLVPDDKPVNDAYLEGGYQGCSEKRKRLTIATRLPMFRHSNRVYGSDEAFGRAKSRCPLRLPCCHICSVRCLERWRGPW